MEKSQPKKEEEKEGKTRTRSFALEVQKDIYLCDDNRVVRTKKGKKIHTAEEMGLKSFTNIAKEMGLDTHSVIRTYHIAMRKIDKALRKLIAKGVL